MNTANGDSFYESYERVRDQLSREEHGPERFDDAAALMEEPSGEESVDGFAVGEDSFVAYDGDLHVRGDITIEDGGILFVRGNLTVAGAIIARGFYNLVVVGGALKAEAVRSSGEIAAIGGIDSERLFWTHSDRYSCYSPKLKTDLYIAQDRVDSIDEVEAEERIQGHVGEIAYELSEAFSTRIWANREEFELDSLRVEEFVRTP